MKELKIRYALKLVLVISLWGVNHHVQAQIVPFPNNYVDLGVGAGPNYGIIGIKSVFGYKGTGLMLGVGSVAGETAYEIGFQAKYLWFFINIGYGTYGVYTIEGFGRKEEGLVNGTIVILGGQINLYNQRLYLEAGFGLHSGGEFKGFLGETIQEEAGVSAVIGIGYRIGGSSD